MSFIYLLLFHLILQLAGYFGFPKGHMEKNETEEQTAIREIFEETGLKVNIIPGFKTINEYPIPHKEVTIKRVIYFLAEYDNQNIRYQKDELLGAYLMTYEEAISLFQFDNLKKVLYKARDFITGR